jgi:hypothetical protein
MTTKETTDLRNLTLGNLYDLKYSLEAWIPTVPEGRQALAQKTLQKVEGALKEHLLKQGLDLGEA